MFVSILLYLQEILLDLDRLQVFAIYKRLTLRPVVVVDFFALV
jgi:hypothetical protein